MCLYRPSIGLNPSMDALRVNRSHNVPLDDSRLSPTGRPAGPQRTGRLFLPYPVRLGAAVSVGIFGAVPLHDGRATSDASGPGACGGCEGRGWKVASPRRALRAPGDPQRLQRRTCPDCGGTGVSDTGSPGTDGTPAG
jgi:hypothetical protein